MSSPLIPVRFETAPRPGSSVRANWQWLPASFADDPTQMHMTLCRVFRLDPVRARFEFPRTIREAHHRKTTRIGGFVFFAGEDRPIAKITIAREGERFADLDPTNRDDFENLERT